MKRAERRALEKARKKAAPRAVVAAPAPADLRDQITAPGQPYVDDPKLRTVAIYGGVGPEVGTVTDGYARTRLNWKRPLFDNAGNCIGFARSPSNQNNT